MQKGASASVAKRLLASWGNTDAGRLGHGTAVTTCLLPRIISALQDQEIVHAACGGAHTTAIAGVNEMQTHGIKLAVPHCSCTQLVRDCMWLNEEPGVQMTERCTHLASMMRGSLAIHRTLPLCRCVLLSNRLNC